MKNRLIPSRQMLVLCLLSVCLLGQAKIPVKLHKHAYYLDAGVSEKDMRSNPHVYRNAVQLLQDIDTLEATVYVAPGVYWIDDPDDKTVRKGINGETPIGLKVKCHHLTLIGLDKDAMKSVFACQRGQTMGAVGNFTMFHFFCDSLRMENITLGNYVNVDLDYPSNPQLSRKRISDNIVQAQLAFMTGKQFSATNCRFLSRLNLCPVIGAEESSYTDCHFESTDDALNGNAVYTHCTFDFYSGKPLYATSGMGAFFEHCTFNIKHNGEQYLTKQSSPVTLVDCHFIGSKEQYIGWTPYPSRALRCMQSGVWLNDSMIVVGAKNPENTVVLPPTAPYRQYAHLQHKTSVVHDGETAHFSITPSLRNDALTQLLLVAKTPEGYETATEIQVLPKHLSAPHFSQQPSCKISDGIVRMDYAFASQNRADQSQITWTRIQQDGSRITVSESTSGTPAACYLLRPEDVGCRLEATITPQQYETDAAAPQTLLTKVITAKDVLHQDTLTTDFRNLPLGNRMLQEGAWTFMGFKPADTQEYPWTVDNSKSYWRYGSSNNGCVGTGLTQTAQGARMVYTPIHRDYGDMSMLLLVDPQKTAGQGFSSATGQYMDVFIKYDTEKMTGYGLRIIRTTKFSNAVDFMLMRYDNGVASAVSEAVSSPCYRTGCQILLSFKDNVLQASVKTSTPLDSASQLPLEVNLKAKVSGNSFGGFGLQHTGTVGEGQTMLHQLQVVY